MSVSLALNENHDIYRAGSSIAFVSGIDAVVQSIETRLAAYEGEWFLDLTDGVPWQQEILIRPADIPSAERIIKGVIQRTPDVADLVSFAIQFDSRTRVMSIQFEATTTFGLTGEVFVVV